MVRSSTGTLIRALVLGLCAPGILATITMTGPSSALSNGLITLTWSSVSTDPTSFEIDIDLSLDSLEQSDSYFIQQNIITAGGSTTLQLPDLEVGTHRIALSSNDGFTIYSESSIEIVSPGVHTETETLPASTVTLPAPSPPSPRTTSRTPSPPPPPPSPSPTSSPSPSASPHTSSASSSQSSASQSPSASSEDDQISPSPSDPSPSPPASASSSQSSASQSQSATNVPDQSGVLVVTHHSNIGAIAGGVVGGILVLVLAFLGWWYARRRRRSPLPDNESPAVREVEQYLPAVPVSAAAPPTPSTAGASASASASVRTSKLSAARERDRAQPRVARWEPLNPAQAAVPAYPGPGWRAFPRRLAGGSPQAERADSDWGYRAAAGVLRV
ncbi:hypothetical protein GGX14DRAFT_446820, partial [Mycena pura]